MLSPEPKLLKDAFNAKAQGGISKPFKIFAPSHLCVFALNSDHPDSSGPLWHFGGNFAL
jgi:hypothetical protein